jgi:tetratricopeptide (TPR) repeat protein
MKTVGKVVLIMLAAVFLSSGLTYGQNGEEPGVGKLKGAKYGADSATCVVHLSLYREFYKQKNYNDAMPHWRWVFFNCPLSSQNLYIDGVKMISDFMEKATDKALKDKYYDTLLMVYDQRISAFDREAYVLGRKGIDMVTYKPENIEDNYNTLKRSVELGGDETEAATVAYYFQTILGMVQAQKLDKTAVIDGYDQLSNIIDNNLTKAQGDEKKVATWGGVKANIETAFEPFASCDDLIPLYEKKFSENSEDVDMLIKMTSMLDRKGCTGSEIFFAATEKLHKLQPGAKSAYLMGSLSFEKKQYSKASEYLNEAVNLADNNEDKIKALNLLAAVNYQLHNYPQARANAMKILQLNPSYGKAYIFIGDLYAASSSMCTDDDLSGKTVFWAAVDMYQKAKSVDPSTAEEVNNKIGQYSRYYPAKDDLFFRDMHEGQSFTVGCWINETTTIRSLK